MSELKHGFGAAKMNKDADERTIPNGEYRDALNVQIVTSDGSDIGTLQTLLGNSKINSTFQGTLSSQAKCVGSVADEANNKIYYFVSDKVNYTDYIFEHTVNGSVKPVVVDKYRINISTSHPSQAQGGVTRFFRVSDISSGIRPGMSVTGIFNSTSTPLVVNLSHQLKIVEMKDSGLGYWEILMDVYSNSISSSQVLETPDGENLILHADRALNFESSQITGINVIDETIYWTDGHHDVNGDFVGSEPKKININNVETHHHGLQHTKFIVRDNNNVLIVDSVATKVTFRENPDYLKEEHLTVIKKSPLYPPTLLFSNTSDFRFDDGGASVLTSDFSANFAIDADGELLETGSALNITFNTLPNYKIGDKILLSRDNNYEESLDLSEYELIVEILEFTPGINAATAKIKIVFIANTLPGHVFVIPQPDLFYSILQQEKPLYEFKFPRFAYRYKYQDDQYSCYSPFSEPAFLPGVFNYKPKNGYNIGMVNTLRSLYITDFVPDADTLPKDVVAIDIVYKESNSNNVYVVETIEYGDAEWTARGSDANTAAANYARTKGALLITSEMVKAAVASNQLLRPWDNVPRVAKAQDIVGNRIVYANYKQNYNLN